MNNNERLEVIRRKGLRNRASDAEKAVAENKIILELTNKVKKLAVRIKDIIVLANACCENGVEIPSCNMYFENSDTGARWGYPHEFIAEGIHQNTGLISDGFCSSKTDVGYKSVGIEHYSKGYSFYTDGSQIFALDKDHKDCVMVPKVADLVQFLEEFPVFEKAFLSWVESLEYA